MDKIGTAGLAYLEHVRALQDARAEAHSYLAKLWAAFLSEVVVPTGGAIVWQPVAAVTTKSAGTYGAVAVSSTVGGPQLGESERILQVLLLDYRGELSGPNGGLDVQVLATTGEQSRTAMLRELYRTTWDRAHSNLSDEWKREQANSVIIRRFYRLSGALVDDTRMLVTAAAEVMKFYEELVGGSPTPSP